MMKSQMTYKGDFPPHLPGLLRVGVITQWIDDKGYGWVESEGERFFAHIKDFDRGQRRPKMGEEVSFVPGRDPKGRTCAKGVTFVKADKVHVVAGVPVGMGGWILLCLMLILPLLALCLLPLLLWMGVGAMLIVSVISYSMYAYDKQQAASKGWRVSEGALHLVEFLGGWPGAFLAQRRLRHKCSKPIYQLVYWMIVIFYQLAAVDMLLNQRLNRAVMRFLNQ